jgi:hypothetical protein
MKFVAAIDNTAHQTDAEVRELGIEEVEFVAGGAGGSNGTTAGQGGGNDGYGGSRRNP